MKPRKIVQAAVILLVISAGGVLSFYCSKKKSELPSESQIRIAAIMIDSEVPFWDEVWKGVREAAEELNAALSEYPYEQRREDITELVETAILAEVDGILLRAQDTPSDTLSKMLKRAMDAGIHVVAVDVDAGETYRDAFIGIDNKDAAETLAEKAAELIGEEECVVIVKTPDEYMAHSASVRVEAFQKAFLQRKPQSMLRVVELPGEDGLRLSAMMNFLDQEEKVGLLFGCAPKVMTTSINAVMRLNLEESVSVIGFGETEEILDALEKGIVQCLAMQQPYEMGWMGLEYLTELCKGMEEENSNEIIVPFQLAVPDNGLEE